MELWKHSFEIVSRELELTRKKKQALDDLLAAGRISRLTYDSLEKEVGEAILELEVHQKSLVGKMTVRSADLERQRESLELFLVNLEIHHVSGEVDEETYVHQGEAIKLGLEATKRELEEITGSLTKFAPPAPVITEDPLKTLDETTVPEPIPEKSAEPSIQVETLQGATEPNVTIEQTPPSDSASPTQTEPQKLTISQEGSPPESKQ